MTTGITFRNNTRIIPPARRRIYTDEEEANAIEAETRREDEVRARRKKSKEEKYEPLKLRKYDQTLSETVPSTEKPKMGTNIPSGGESRNDTFIPEDVPFSDALELRLSDTPPAGGKRWRMNSERGDEPGYDYDGGVSNAYNARLALERELEREREQQSVAQPPDYEGGEPGYDYDGGVSSPYNAALFEEERARERERERQRQRERESVAEPPDYDGGRPLQPEVLLDEGELNSFFKKIMGSSFNPKSSMDTKKMEILREFKQKFPDLSANALALKIYRSNRL